jgi:DinB superfamily
MLDRRVEIIKTLRATPVVLRALVAGVDEGQLRRRPAPGEWAIIEVVGHLADTEERALGRVRRMLAEDDPKLEPFDQEALAAQGRYLELDLQAELACLDQLRGQHLAVLERLDAPAWERTGRHGEHGTMSVELYETHVAAEEVDHLAQIARLLEAT